MNFYPNIFFTIFSLLIVNGASQTELSVSPKDVTLIYQQSINITFTLPSSPVSAVINVAANHPDLVSVRPPVINVLPSTTSQLWVVELFATEVGHAIISANTSQSEIRVSNAFVRVTLQHSEAVLYISIVVGWIYFVAWSVSFYPQIYINWKRKSVVGLNFDFLSLNVVGFMLYSLFNCGLFWIPTIEAEYFSRYPRGLNPVQINDIVFALHAAFATIITLVQCCIYEREDQRVSITARVILGIFALFLLISVIIAATNVITWLDFLYYCSYVKLSITLIKYVPQAYMNYRRKSTLGWSIGNIFLDFTGGMLSMLQMILNAYNHNDWESIFGDPTKFGLGLFSVVFDIFFILQHYVFYRHPPDYENLIGENSSVIPEKPSVYT